MMDNATNHDDTETHPTSEQPRLIPTFPELADLASRTTLILVGACYAVGLLIINLHLGRYGLPPAEFLRADYVLAGGLWFFLMGFTHTFFFFSWHRLRATYLRRDRRFGVAAASATAEAIMLFFGLHLALNQLSDNSLSFFNHEKIPDTLNVIGSLGICAMTLDAIRGNFAKSDLRQLLSIPPGLSAALFPLVFTVIMFAGSLFLYVHQVFPYFSPTLGGGMTRSVSLFVAPDKVDALRSMGLSVMPGSNEVGPVDMILEASNDLVMVKPSATLQSQAVEAVKVNKEFVYLVVYHGRKDRFRPLEPTASTTPTATVVTQLSPTAFPSP